MKRANKAKLAPDRRARQRGERLRRQALRVWARGVVRGRLRRLQRELDRLDRNPHPEAIHQVRVASRRLRASLRHLAPCFRQGEVERLRAAVSRLARALGQMRDLDILIENLAEDARRPGSAIAPLVKAMKARRQERLHRALPEARLLRHRLPTWQEKLNL